MAVLGQVPCIVEEVAECQRRVELHRGYGEDSDGEMQRVQLLPIRECCQKATICESELLLHCQGIDALHPCFEEAEKKRQAHNLRLPISRRGCRVGYHRGRKLKTHPLAPPLLVLSFVEDISDMRMLCIFSNTSL